MRQFAHVLPGNTNDVRNIRESDQVRSSLNQRCLRNCSLDVGQRAGQRKKCTFSFARKLKRKAARLPDADQRIIAAGLTQSLHQCIRIAVIIGHAIVQSERKFHV